MRILRIKDFLLESNLDIKELDRPVAKTGEKKGDVLIQKIENEDPLTVEKPKGTKQDIIVSNIDLADKIKTNGRYDGSKGKMVLRGSSNQYPEVIIGDNDDQYRLTNVVKTEDFGSSGGTSLGTKGTLEMECIQCVVMALRQLSMESISEDDYQLLMEDSDLLNRCLEDVDNPIVVDVNLLTNFSHWVESFVTTANSMYIPRYVLSDKRRAVFRRRKKYKFIHANSELSKKIFKTYSKFSKINRNKWMPVDMWAIDSDEIVTVNDSLDIFNQVSESTIVDFNEFIDTLFDDDILVGISLKKNDRENFNIIINKETTQPKYVFSKILFSDPLNRSKGIDIVADLESPLEEREEKMQITTDKGSKISNILGKITRETARMGSIGLSPINNILSKYNVEVVPEASELEGYSVRYLKSKIISVYNDIWKEEPYTGKITREEISDLISMFQSLTLSNILLKTDPKKRDKIINDIYCYALSIRTDEFDSPKYVRTV